MLRLHPPRSVPVVDEDFDPFKIPEGYSTEPMYNMPNPSSMTDSGSDSDNDAVGMVTLAYISMYGLFPQLGCWLRALLEFCSSLRCSLAQCRCVLQMCCGLIWSAAAWPMLFCMVCNPA